jgi:hypothetical protein
MPCKIELPMGLATPWRAGVCLAGRPQATREVPDSQNELRAIHRLGEKQVRPFLIALKPIGSSASRRDDDQPKTGALQKPGNIESTSVRQPEIDQGDIEILLSDCLAERRN